jgi:adenylate kinase
MKVLMLAPPGGGKGTQGARIADALGVEHVSSGELLREAVAQDTPLGRSVGEYLKAGKLAPDDLVTQALKPILESRDGYVLDGFPRTLKQTDDLEFDAVVYLDVPDRVITERLLARGREDDQRDVIAERLRQYVEDTEPLIEHYRDQGVLIRVDGDRPVEEITEDVLARLRDRA